MRTVDALNEFGRARARSIAIVGAGLVCLEVLAGSAAHAQALEQASGGNTTAAAIALGGRGWSASETVRTTPAKERETTSLEFSARAGLASDYIYRGTTLSDRKPAVGGGIEAALAWFYAGASVASVKLPTEPVAEITATGGVRPKIGNIDFDFGVTYFHYPGELVSGATNGIDYWEAAARADTKIGESIRIAGSFAFSPNVSNTGAWS